MTSRPQAGVGKKMDPPILKSWFSSGVEILVFWGPTTFFLGIEQGRAILNSCFFGEGQLEISRFSAAPMGTISYLQL